MKKLSLLLAVTALIFTTSCKDDNLGPIITFDKADKGAYVKLLEESGSTSLGARAIDLFDVAGSVYTYSVEFVDLEMGNLVSEYRLDATYRDNNKDNGDNSGGPLEFGKWGQSDFGTSERGFKSLTDIKVAATDLLNLFGVTAESVLAGDQFVMEGTLTLQDGSSFTFGNSTAAVNGSAFGGHFRWTLNATCPTSLGGTYDYTVLASWCGGLDCPTGQLTLTDEGDGYSIDDFSLGAYNQCYSPCTAGATLPGGSLRFLDICNTIEITGLSRWDEKYTYHSFTVSGKDMTIEWTNDYGEGGTTIIHHPTGWPDLQLKG